MDDTAIDNASRFLSRQLRHAPDPSLGMDRNGYVAVPALVALMVAKGLIRSAADLYTVVHRDGKERFEFLLGYDERGCAAPEGARLRACSGHSLDVELDPMPREPTHPLWFGTVGDAADLIAAEGLVRGRKRHVRLSATESEAWAIAEERVATALERRGTDLGGPAVFRVDAERMAADGHAFGVVANGEIIGPKIGPEYVERVYRAPAPRV